MLFELIAERYERKSVAITANAPFSEWDEVFPDKAMTVAAVDRLVHHATILETATRSSNLDAGRPWLICATRVGRSSFEDRAAPASVAMPRGSIAVLPSQA